MDSKMPQHHYETFEKNGHIRTHVTVVQGEAISLCRCWRSKKFPLCDGSHNDMEDGKGPVVIHVDCEKHFLDQAEG